MKNSLIGRLLKNVTAIALGIVLLVTGVCFIPTNANKTHASGSVKELVNGTSCVQEFTYQEFKKYRGTTNTAPQAPNQYSGWLFAGWFTSSDCKTAIDTVTEGPVYAKFVSPEVLIVGCQVSDKTTSETADSTADVRLRLVTTVDSSKYAKIGFKIIGKKVNEFWGTTVYGSIASTEDDVEYKYKPSVFNEGSKYFYTLKLNKLQKDTPYTVTPCWETLDGTVVDGVTRYVRISDSWNQYINVPVRLYTGAEVGAGYLEVTYPEGYTFDVAANVNTNIAGTIFENMQISHDETQRTIKCVGYVNDISKNKNADGMYLNLRFKTTVTAPEDRLNLFQVKSLNFCNVSEENVTVGAQAVCLNFND